jgi:hypothetical protein
MITVSTKREWDRFIAASYRRTHPWEHGTIIAGQFLGLSVVVGAMTWIVAIIWVNI